MFTPISIIVKSFNRPYYLDRCLQSIFKYVSGDYNVIVVDDGTPPIYLDKIKKKHPKVTMVYSDLYEEKVAQLQAHAFGTSSFNLKIIPSKLWVKAVQDASQVFCMLEDDVWITVSFDISEISNHMRTREIVLAKMYWGGNTEGFPSNVSKEVHGLQEYVPDLPKGPEWLTRMLLLNNFKIYSAAYRLRFVKEAIYFQLPFYGLYSVASAFFDKSYWLHLWEDKQIKADEVYQLSKALNWVKHHPSGFAKTQHQLTETSFISSATNTFKDVDFDVIAASHYLNEAWLRGELDAMQNYPKDFTPEYLKPIFDNAADTRCTFENWLQWIKRFKGLYSSMGVTVD